MTNKPKYQRILLKLSGEGLVGKGGFGIDPVTIEYFAEEIKSICNMGVQVCVVIGGGNYFRGSSASALGIERTNADYMGMLATVMNALAIQSVLERKDIPTRVLSAIPMQTICEPYIRRRAIQHLEKGRVIILTAGTGSPFFTTDTAAALRTVEIGCDVLLKGTQVDGVYDADPKKAVNAKRYERLSYDRVLSDNLKIMDATAIALVRENAVPILIFSVHEAGNLAQVVCGMGQYTIIN